MAGIGLSGLRLVALALLCWGLYFLLSRGLLWSRVAVVLVMKKDVPLVFLSHGNGDVVVLSDALEAEDAALSVILVDVACFPLSETLAVVLSGFLEAVDSVDFLVLIEVALLPSSETLAVLLSEFLEASLVDSVNSLVLIEVALLPLSETLAVLVSDFLEAVDSMDPRVLKEVPPFPFSETDFFGTAGACVSVLLAIGGSDFFFLLAGGGFVSSTTERRRRRPDNWV